MTCQHCFARRTTHPSGYCRACRIWLQYLGMKLRAGGR
jgi:hypothetical protein